MNFFQGIFSTYNVKAYIYGKYVRREKALHQQHTIYFVDYKTCYKTQFTNLTKSRMNMDLIEKIKIKDFPLST